MTEHSLRMQTLLLPERCEQSGRRKGWRAARAMSPQLSKTTAPRRVFFQVERSETVLESNPFRFTESHEYRHWGINE